MFRSVRWLPEAASTVAGQVDALYLFTVAVSILSTIAVGLLVIYLTIRYRRRHDDEVGVPIHGSTMLEIGWSVFPFVVMLLCFAWGAKVFFTQSRPPAQAVEYFVTGKQWMWKFQHPDGHREINDLHVPIGVPIKLTMTSEDVLHSLFFPSFRVKSDLVPGRYTTVWFEATKTGTYHIFCAEYCGSEHSRMIGRVFVLEPQEYQDWLAGGGATKTAAARGEELFTSLACVSCHRMDSKLRAPILAGIYGRKIQLQNGSTVTADEGYLRESILNPMARVVAGYQPVMPTFQGQISEEDLLQLIAYIKTLKLEGGVAMAASANAPAVRSAAITQDGKP